MAYMLEYDTVHGRLRSDISSEDGTLIVDGMAIKVFAEKDPANLPWGDVGASVVVESTGVFTSLAKAQAHIDGGCDKVCVLTS